MLDRKIDEQLKNKKLEVDIAFFQTAQDFVRWKGEGVLLSFRPDGYDKIDPRFNDRTPPSPRSGQRARLCL